MAAMSERFHVSAVKLGKTVSSLDEIFHNIWVKLVRSACPCFMNESLSHEIIVVADERPKEAWYENVKLNIKTARPDQAIFSAVAARAKRNISHESFVDYTKTHQLKYSYK